MQSIGMVKGRDPGEERGSGCRGGLVWMITSRIGIGSGDTTGWTIMIGRGGGEAAGTIAPTGIAGIEDMVGIGEVYAVRNM